MNTARQSLRELSLRDAPLSAYILIAINILPLVGVVFFNWSIFEIMLLYWSESAIIGFFNVIKMLIAPGIKKLFLIPFFMIHFGGFMLGHLIFILVIFNQLDPNRFLPDFTKFSSLFIPFLCLFLSHAASFFFNYIGRQEYKQVKVDYLFAAPYGRIILMHVTIFVGAFAVNVIHAPVVALAFLVLFKTVFDLAAHLSEHRKFRTKPQLT